MMKYLFILYLINPWASACLGQTPADSRVNGTKIATIDEYERLIKYYRYYKQDSAVYYAEKGIEFARQQKDSSGVALMLIQMGMIDDNLGEFDQSVIKYNKALEIFQAIDSKKGIGSTTIRIGVVDLRNGKYDNAIRHFLSALRTGEESGDRFIEMEANYSISWAYLDQRNYKMALRYLKTAERLNDSLPFSSLSLNIFNHMGVVYRETGNYETARRYLEKGVALSTDMENQGLNITLVNNLASVYSKIGLTQKAIALQKEALERSRILGNYLRELQVLYGLARTYKDKDPSKAIVYLRQAIELSKQKGAYNQEIRYLKAITPIYVEQGNYQEAFLMKEREKTLADSFLYKSVSKNIESLKAEYELSKSNAKIKELDLLSTKRQLELKNATLVRNVTFAGIALLLIILSLLFNRYKIKQRNNQEISQKNDSLRRLLDEKEWLLKEVHHRVKNNLHTIMSLLETQSAYLKGDALLAIQNSQHRVYVMSLIHQKLYQVDNTTSIDMSVYLSELVNYLRESFDVAAGIRFCTQIDKIYLDISQAIPVGLILNEAITNAIKYAFPVDQNGDITILMNRTAGEHIRLTIADNGIGIPDQSRIHGNSLGLKLMKGLSEDLHATFTIEKNNGTMIRVEFREQHFLQTASKNGKIKIIAMQS